jgi:hypothetical protein
MLTAACSSRRLPALAPAPVYAGDFSAAGRLHVASFSGAVLLRRRNGALSLACLADGGLPLASGRIADGRCTTTGPARLAGLIGELMPLLERAFAPPPPATTDDGPIVTWDGDPLLPRQVSGAGLALRPGDYRIIAGALVAHRLVITGWPDGSIALDRVCPLSAR